MTISVRKTVIEVDVSQALQAEARLTAANEARRQSARELAQIIEAGEREQIAALKASTNEVKRAAGARREAALVAKQALSEATEAERSARQELAARVKEQREAARAQMAEVRAAAVAQRELEAERRRAAAQQRSFLDAVMAAERELGRVEQARLSDSRAKQLALAAESEHHARLMAAYGADESAVMRRQEKALLERAKAERIIGNEVAARQADMQRELVTIQRIEAAERERARADFERREAGFGAAVEAAGQRANEQGFTVGGASPVKSTREWSDAVRDVRQSYTQVASSIGGIITGIQSAVAISREVVTFVDDTVRESFEVQSIARNLQLDIGPARAALQGLVADKDLALAANKAVAMGVAQTGVEFAHIAEMVSTQAIKLGKDSTQLINDYVEAVGKQEAEIFDNLGLVLRLTDAYQIYADSVGKSVKDLTAHEKSIAFNKAALISLEKATGQAASRVDGFADSWVKMTVSVSNIKAGFLGFEDTAGRVNEALRIMSDEEIDRLGRLAKSTKFHGQSLDDIETQLKQWRLSLADLKKIADEQGVSFEQLLENAKAAHAEQARVLKEQAELAAEQQRIQELNTAADDQEHLAKLLAITGAKKSEIRQIELESLTIQHEAAVAQAAITKSTEDEAKARKLSQQIELKQAEIEFGKSKGGRKRDPNEELDRRTAATLRLLKAEEKIIDAQADAVRTVEEQRELQQRLNDLALRELEVRTQAADVRKVKGAKEADKLEAERLEIQTQRQLLAMDIEAQAFEQSKANAERRIAFLEREIERNEAIGVSVKLLQQQRADAELAYAEQFQTVDDAVQVRHDQEVARIQAARDARVAAAQEKLDEYNRDVELWESRGSVEQDFAQRRIELELRVAQAAGDTDRVRQLMHAREVARIKREVETRKLATSATSQLLTQGMSLFTFVADRAVKDEAKREKAMMRARGIEAMVRGAIETVEAVAAFASFNFVQGALHTAAAAVAYGTGISLLAGKMPAKQGASVGGAAGGGAEHQTVLSDEDRGAADRGRAVVPASAEELIRLRQGSQGTVQTTASKEGGNVYQIGTIVAGDAGTLINDLDDQQARKWGTP